MRLLATLFLAVVAIVLGLLAWGSLSNLWADNPDNSAGTYLWVGGLALAGLGVSVAAAVGIWRDQ
jgi:hypothetical protein